MSLGTYGMNNIMGPYGGGLVAPPSIYNAVNSGILPGMAAAQAKAQAAAQQNRPGANSTTPNNITNGVSPNGGAQVPGKSGTNPGTPTAMSSVSALQQIMGGTPGGMWGAGATGSNGTGLMGNNGSGIMGVLGNLGNSTLPGTGLMGSIGNLFMGGGRVQPNTMYGMAQPTSVASTAPGTALPYSY